MKSREKINVPEYFADQTEEQVFTAAQIKDKNKSVTSVLSVSTIFRNDGCSLQL